MKFETFSESEISKLAEVQVYKGHYYDSGRQLIEGGLLDPRMVQLWLIFECVHILINAGRLTHWIIEAYEIE